MATFLISIFAALSIVIIIIVLGIILAQIFINRADKAQTSINMISEPSQGVFVDMDDLPNAHQEPGVTITSNDVIEVNSHPHHDLKNKTVSIINQTAEIGYIDSKNITTGQIHTYKSLTVPTKTDSGVNTSTANPLTDKITIEY